MKQRSLLAERLQLENRKTEKKDKVKEEILQTLKAEGAVETEVVPQNELGATPTSAMNGFSQKPKSKQKQKSKRRKRR